MTRPAAAAAAASPDDVAAATKALSIADVPAPMVDVDDDLDLAFEPEPDEYIECTLCGHSERRPSPEDVQQMQTHTEADAVGVVKFMPASPKNS